MSAITAQRDAPIGSIISQGSVTTLISCNTAGAGPSDWSWRVYPAGGNMDFGSGTEPNMRATAWPGVGIRWMNLSSVAPGVTTTWTTQALNSWTKAYARGMPLNVNNVFTDTFELVKTGPIASGILPSMNLQYFHATPRSNNVDAYLFSLNIPEMPVRVVACAVTQTSVVVPMGDFIPKTRFSGPGSTDTDVPFNVALNCDSSAQINIQLDGVAAGGAPGILRLNAQAGAAWGLGVQVLSGGLPVTFGVPMPVGSATVNGPYAIDFVARYYQVDAVVESGVANATATFTMTYD
jgi:type 1 fimbria pilin